MDTLETMRVFVRVTQLGSFAAAARDLRMSPSSVTKHVAALEARLRTRLLERTTRRITLTEGGRLYLERSLEALQVFEDADASLVELMQTPRGTLRVTAPIDFGQRQLAVLLAPFVHAWPDVVLDLRLSNHAPDLVQDGVDVSLRWAPALDGRYVARPLARSRMALMASPAYLRRHGVPRHPDELAAHRFLVFSEPSPKDEVLFVRGAEEVRVHTPHRVLTNSGEVLQDLLRSDVGLAVMPSFLSGHDHALGLIEPVLGDWSLGELRLFAVYPQRRYMAPKVRVFLELLAHAWGGPTEDPWWPVEPPAQR